MSSEPTRRLLHARRVGAAALTLAVLALAAPLTSCGKKGAPMPPPSRLPKPASDLKVEQWGETVRLEFSYPTVTVGGLPLSGIKAVEVWEVVRPFLVLPTAPAAAPAVSGEEETTTGESATPAAAEEATPRHHHGNEVAEPAAGEGAPAEETPATETPSTEAPSTESTGEAAGEAAQSSESAQGSETAQPQTTAGESTSTAAGEGSSTAADEGTSTTTQPARAMPAPKPSIMSADFKANAKQLSTVEGDELKAAILGGKILLEIPTSSLHTLPPAEPQEESDENASSTPAASTEESATAESAPEATSAEATAETAPAEGEEGATPPAPKPTVEEVHYFAVRTISEDGKTSDFSRVAYLVAGTAAAAPTDLSATATELGISLTWTLPEDAELTGVQVYRRDQDQSVFEAPLSRLGDDATSYTDRTAQFGREYTYAVTAVTRQDPLIQSALSETATLQFADIYQPQPPGRLDLFAEPTRVRLIWEAPTSTDVAGYRVERAGADGHFTILNSEMVTTPEYIDQKVERGATYSYRVVTLDTAGNASEPSPIETTRIP